MATTKYKTKSYSTGIEPVEVIRETDQSVFLAGLRKSGERREAKISDWTQYHSSWVDAHAYLLNRAEEKVRCCHSALNSATGELDAIKGMKRPA